MAKLNTYKYQSDKGHDWQAEPLVEGEVVAVGSFALNKRNVRWCEVKTSDGIVRVLEFAALTKAFDVITVGDSVYFAYKGTATGAGGNEYFRFEATVAAGEGGVTRARKTKPRKVQKPRARSKTTEA